MDLGEYELEKSRWPYKFEATAAVIVFLLLSAIFLPKFLKYMGQIDEAQKTQYSVSLPPGAKDSIPAYPGEYITVTSNPQTGPYCLTRGIWLIEMADRNDGGLIVLRGHQTDDAGVTTRVTLTMTTNHFVENNSGMAFTLISKSSSSFDKVAAAFSGNDFVAKNPK